MSHRDHTLPRFAIGRASTLLGQRTPLEADTVTLQDILAIRHEQVVKHGHTPAEDARLPPANLPKQARAYIDDAIDDLMRGKREAAIRRLIKAGALLLAAIARLKNGESS